MTAELEIQRCSRHCSVTGRRLADGEEYLSALVLQGGALQRLDYATEAWNGPPEGAIGWWRARVPTPETRRARWAPNDVLLEVFQELRERPEQADECYVMALLLVRRRIMRLEETVRDAAGQARLMLYCPRDEQNYEVPVMPPNEDRVQLIQSELERLLFAGSPAAVVSDADPGSSAAKE